MAGLEAVCWASTKRFRAWIAPVWSCNRKNSVTQVKQLADLVAELLAADSYLFATALQRATPWKTMKTSIVSTSILTLNAPSMSIQSAPPTQSRAKEKKATQSKPIKPCPSLVVCYCGKVTQQAIKGGISWQALKISCNVCIKDSLFLRLEVLVHAAADLLAGWASANERCHCKTRWQKCPTFCPTACLNFHALPCSSFSDFLPREI